MKIKVHKKVDARAAEFLNWRGEGRYEFNGKEYKVLDFPFEDESGEPVRYIYPDFFSGADIPAGPEDYWFFTPDPDSPYQKSEQ